VVPAKTLLNAGVKVVFETDGGPEWYCIELFVTRKDSKGKVWGPQERVDRPTILKMATRWAAEYVLRPDRIGSIEPGKLADIAVLDRDFMTIPEDDISEIESSLTLMDGRMVYVNKSFAEEYNLKPAGAVISTFKELRERPALGQGGSGMDTGG
jgi:predicted amidohydrolase YtcJ